MESWRKVWREGLAPQLSDAAIRSLQKALAADDPRLQQWRTTTPPPLAIHQLEEVCEACALAYCGWEGKRHTTVGKVEKFFVAACVECDRRMGEPGACRWFLNWFDELPREQAFRELLGEVDLALSSRTGGSAA